MLSERVKYLVGSENRIKILSEVNKNAIPPREIIDVLDISRSTVQRCLARFADFGWVHKSNGRYHTTTGGSIILSEYYTLTEQDEIIQYINKIYNTDSSDLKRLRFNKNSKNISTYIESNTIQPCQASKYCIDQITNSKSTNIKAIVSVIDNVLYEFLNHLADKNISAQLLLQKNIEKNVVKHINSKFNELSEDSNIQFLSSKSTFEYSMFISKQKVLINTYNNGNNVSSCLMCPDPEIINQAKSIFEGYLKKNMYESHNQSKILN